MLGGNADTDEESVCIPSPLLGSSDEGIGGFIIDEVFFTEIGVSFFTFLLLLSLCTLFLLVFLRELSLFSFLGA